MRYLIEGHLLSVAMAVLTIILVVRILDRQRRPGTTFAWILAIILVPYIGIPAYVVFGGRKLAGIRKRKCVFDPERNFEAVRINTIDNPAENLLSSSGVSLPTKQNRIEFVSDGRDTYARLVEGIENADISIYLETYIFANDRIGRDLTDRLCRKARAGVDVRVLVDSYGAWPAGWRMLTELKKAGGKVAWFLPMLPYRRNWSINLRNHRKLFIFDQRFALIGGMNLGEDYMGPNPDPARWVDSAVELEGPAVQDAVSLFCSDWNFTSAEETTCACDAYGDPPPDSPEGVAQIAASGPDVEGDPIYEALLSSIHAAQQRVWMVTPYFGPGEELFRALLIQARTGKDVRLLMPAKSNHKPADLIRAPYLRHLAKAGGKIFLYEDSMVHAKNMIFDHHTAVVGTVNLDMRSLYLNFEVAVFTYSEKQIAEIAAWMEDLMERASPYRYETPTRAMRFLEHLSLLVSPLL